MNTLTSNQRVLIAVLVGFIIGAAAIWIWTVSRSVPKGNAVEDSEVTGAVGETSTARGDQTLLGSPEKKTIGKTETKPSTGVVSLDNSELIRVLAQTAGTQVTAHVIFDAPGWVAVHEERDGELGNVLGASWLPEGEHDVTVELLRGTLAGQIYHAVLYNDDGDRIFEYKSGDVYLLDGSKQPIQATFTVK